MKHGFQFLPNTEMSSHARVSYLGCRGRDGRPWRPNHEGRRLQGREDWLEGREDRAVEVTGEGRRQIPATEERRAAGERGQAMGGTNGSREGGRDGWRRRTWEALAPPDLGGRVVSGDRLLLSPRRNEATGVRIACRGDQRQAHVMRVRVVRSFWRNPSNPHLDSIFSTGSNPLQPR